MILTEKAECSNSNIPDGSANTQPFEGFKSAAQAALAYMLAEFAPLPLHPKSKKPNMTDWPNFKCTAGEIPKHFAGEINIGVLLGEPSDGLVDIDLDTPEAVALAPDFLPPCGCVFGRDTSRASHYEYRVEDPGETHRWEVGSGKGKGTLLEYRATGGHTVFPPSMHESGESITFEEG